MAEALVEDGDSLEEVDEMLYKEIRRSAAADIRRIKESKQKEQESE